MTNGFVPSESVFVAVKKKTLGTMFGIEVDKDPSGQVDEIAVNEIVVLAKARGLLRLTAKMLNNVTVGS
jgi:hypothetical protein